MVLNVSANRNTFGRFALNFSRKLMISVVFITLQQCVTALTSTITAIVRLLSLLRGWCTLYYASLSPRLRLYTVGKVLLY